MRQVGVVSLFISKTILANYEVEIKRNLIIRVYFRWTNPRIKNYDYVKRNTKVKTGKY